MTNKESILIDTTGAVNGYCAHKPDDECAYEYPPYFGTRAAAAKHYAECAFDAQIGDKVVVRLQKPTARGYKGRYRATVSRAK